MIKTKYKAADAFKEHLLQGNRISLLEAMLLFGVQNPNAELGRLKKQGFIIKSKKVLMVKIVTRLNRYIHCQPPPDLPTKEIMMTEYWISQ